MLIPVGEKPNDLYKSERIFRSMLYSEKDDLQTVSRIIYVDFYGFILMCKRKKIFALGKIWNLPDEKYINYIYINVINKSIRIQI